MELHKESGSWCLHVTLWWSAACQVSYIIQIKTTGIIDCLCFKTVESRFLKKPPRQRKILWRKWAVRKIEGSEYIAVLDIIVKQIDSSYRAVRGIEGLRNRDSTVFANLLLHKVLRNTRISNIGVHVHVIHTLLYNWYDRWLYNNHEWSHVRTTVYYLQTIVY